MMVRLMVTDNSDNIVWPWVVLFFLLSCVCLLCVCESGCGDGISLRYLHTWSPSECTCIFWFFRSFFTCHGKLKVHVLHFNYVFYSLILSYFLRIVIYMYPNATGFKSATTTDAVKCSRNISVKNGLSLMMSHFFPNILYFLLSDCLKCLLFTFKRFQ